MVSRGEAPTSGPWLKGIGREPVQVGESFELRGEYVDVGGVLGNLVLAGQDTDDDYYIDEIVAIDVMTGEELWHEDGTSVAVLADLIYIADGDDVQGYDKDGKKIGDSASAEFGYVSGLRNRFLQVSYEGDGYGFDLVDPATMEVFEGVVAYSANLEWALTLSDWRADEVSFTVVSLTTGEEAPDEIDAAYYPSMDVLDSGAVVMVDGDRLTLYDRFGVELTDMRVDEYAEVSAAGDVVHVSGDGEYSLYRLAGDTLVQLGRDEHLGSGEWSYLAPTSDGARVVVNDDGEVTISRVTDDGAQELFSASGSLASPRSEGLLYVVDDGDVEGWSTSGGDAPLWKFNGGNNTQVVIGDGWLVTVDANSDGSTNEVTLYR